MQPRSALAASLLLFACHEEPRTAAQLAEAYAAAPREHYEDLTAAAKKWLPEDVFENEPLLHVSGARCTPSVERKDRIEYQCTGGGQSRKLVLVQEGARWRVAETSRALRLMRKATVELDAYSAVSHGAEIDPEEPLFEMPLARHFMSRVHGAERAAKRLRDEGPRAAHVLARKDLEPKDRAEILFGRSWLELSAARAAPDPAALLAQSAADAAEAGKLDPALAKELSIQAGYRERFRRGQRDEEWLAFELKNRRDLAAQPGSDAHALYVRARDLSQGALREDCGKLKEWRGVLGRVDTSHVELRLPAGDDFAVVLTSKEPLDAEVLEAASKLQPGQCVIFSGEADGCLKGDEAAALRAPRFEVDVEELKPCSGPAPEARQREAQADQRR